MVVWQILGNAIGPDDAGAHYLPTKQEAQKAMREHRQWCKEHETECYVSLNKITINNAQRLCEELNHAMGHGAS